jgi:hypothetical protein
VKWPRPVVIETGFGTICGVAADAPAAGALAAKAGRAVAAGVVIASAAAKATPAPTAKTGLHGRDRRVRIVTSHDLHDEGTAPAGPPQRCLAGKRAKLTAFAQF